MRKNLLLLGLLFTTLCVAQNTVVIQQSTNGSTSQSTNNNAYYIQGIPSTENIGGVDVTTQGNNDPYGNPYLYYVNFKNYRNFPVTVLFEFTYGHPKAEDGPFLYEGSITLDAGETKTLSRRYNSPRNFKMIVRALN